MRKTGEILSALRRLMSNLPNNLGSIEAYIIPSGDAHGSEYLADHDQRRAFVSGFDGSLGTAVVTQNEALLWTDGRYYEQASLQLDENWTLQKDGLSNTPTIDNWLAKNFTKARIGVDSNLLSSKAWTPWATTLKQVGSTLMPVEPNLVDLIWENQPVAPSNKVIPLSCEFAGKTIAEKLQEVREKMNNNRSSVVALSALDEVAWLFNLRGSDIEFNPVFFAFVIITIDDLILFIDESKLGPEVYRHFQENDVEVSIRPYGDFRHALAEISALAEGKVWISGTSSYALTSLVPENKQHHEITPICLMKAIKNDIEAKGMKECHIRDGLALCQYFAWLENQIKNGKAVDEISGATQLEEFRKKQDKFMGLSFATISSSGPNAAIIHYHPRPETNRPITDKEVYLCDSGAQYL